MSQSEDYLDGLLNSINKAKTDVSQVEEQAQQQQKKKVETRKAIAPEDDFFAATGIDIGETKLKSSHPYLRKVLSEDEFLRDFEAEMESGDTDAFLESFEREIDEDERLFEEEGKISDSEKTVNALLDNIDNAVNDAQKQIDDDSDVENVNDESEESDDFSLDDNSLDEDVDIEVNETETPSEDETDTNDLENMDFSKLMDSIEEPELTPLEEEEDNEADELENESEDEDDFGFSLDDNLEDTEEELLDESMKEFMPDEMDALDAAEFGEDGEEPDLSGEGDLDLSNILGEDEDLMDIQSLLDGDVPEGAGEIDESAESLNEPEAEDDGKKGKKKKGKKAKGEKKPNPLIQKLLLIIFGPPDEDEIAEMEAEKAAKEAAAKVEITYDEEGNPIIPEGAEDPKDKKKKKKEKKEKPPKEKKEKKEKPPKPPKEKKPKKPKEPDNSPKIPLSIIATFLVLSISIIGVVLVGMNYMGIQRHMSQAHELYEAQDYIAAYEKLNGFDLSDEDDILLRNQARVLADVQQCQNEYETFIEYEIYDFALDALIKGVGRYEKYKDEAAEYGISEEYDAYGQLFISELSDTFGLSEEDALNIFNQKNRHYYTVELRKVLIKLGLEEQ